MAKGGWTWAPNALTVARIALSTLVFFILLAAAGALPGHARPPSVPFKSASLALAVVLFVLAAVTDFFDGYLARKLNATSAWGVILDPIADKIAILAAIFGLMALEPGGVIALPGFVILFREMFVSGLREGLAPRGIKLPVTTLAKWKTTVQLAALALEMPATLLPASDPLRLAAHGLLWLAALLTLWTGWDYSRGAAAALRS